MKSSVDKFLGWMGFALLGIPILIGPWLFGAKEMWWFWPFAVAIFTATAIFALRLLLHLLIRPGYAGQATFNFLLFSFFPFLVYAFIRFLQAEVYMDAERMFLLFLLPFLAGVHIVFGFTGKQLRLLYLLILSDLCLLGVYGLINHALTGSRLVMWLPGFSQYVSDNRATGSYYCPDHFAGIMELALCLCIGIMLSRQPRRNLRILAGLISIIALAGIFLSKSRGGGLTVVVVMVAALIWSFHQWPVAIRWCWRVMAVSLLALMLLGFWSIDSHYKQRFVQYFRPHKVSEEVSFNSIAKGFEQRIKSTSRYVMISGALRAWKSAPVFGIGPGMHQNLWPHFGTSADGDPDLGIWPTSRIRNHSYHAHCDWVQLLEEYGLIGFALFLIPVITLFKFICHALRIESKDWEKNKWQKSSFTSHAAILGGLLSIICMAFHSLGDFNLQIPATGWLFGAIIAIAIGVTPQHSFDAQADDTAS